MAEKTKAELQKDIEALQKTNEAQTKELEEAKAKNEAMKAEATEQRKAKAEDQKKSMKDKLGAEKHNWVRVFNVGLKDGVDFPFNYEGVQFKLYSGKPVLLPQSVVTHLQGCAYPITKLKQGETGQAVKVEGKHHNFNVVPCEAPAKKKTA